MCYLLFFSRYKRHSDYCAEDSMNINNSMNKYKKKYEYIFGILNVSL